MNRIIGKSFDEERAFHHSNDLMLENVKFIESDMFVYMPDDKIIEYAVIIDEYEIEGNKFLEGYLKDKFNIYIPQEKMFIFSLLHEIGHFMTYDNIDQEQYGKDLRNVEDDDFLAYRQVYGEYIADAWAIDFINHNKKGKFPQKVSHENFPTFQQKIQVCLFQKLFTFLRAW